MKLLSQASLKGQLSMAVIDLKMLSLVCAYACPTIANNDWMRQYVHVTCMFKATLMRCTSMHVYVCMVNLTQIKRRVWATHHSWRPTFTSTHWQNLYSMIPQKKKNKLFQTWFCCISDFVTIILCQANCTCTMYIGKSTLILEIS